MGVVCLSMYVHTYGCSVSVWEAREVGRGMRWGSSAV